MAEIVALGDTNVDLISRFSSYPAKGQDALASSTEFHCGGSAANTAIALSRMGFEVLLISRVGCDPLASKVVDSLRDAQVILTGLQRDPKVVTGLMYVIVTPDGERTILGHRGANALTDPKLIQEKDFRQARLFHLSGYALLAEPQRSAALLALARACEHGLAVTLDPGMAVPQDALDEMRALLPVVDVLMPNHAEACRLAGATTPSECVERLLESGVQAVALKLGRDGCLIGSGDGLFTVPAFSVDACDSTGAGDMFAAGVIAGYLGGLPWRSVGLLANAMGAMAASRVGAGTSVPHSREILELLGEHLGDARPGQAADAVWQAIDYVKRLAPEPGEEGKRRWK
jgi:ribokinase